MRFSRLFLLFAWALAVSVLHVPAHAASRTLARVGGEPITGEELREAFAAQHMGHMSFLVGRTQVEQALESLIDKRLLIQEAERMDLASRPEIRAGLDELVGRLAVKHLMKVEVQDAAQPTEAEIRAAYDHYTGSLLKVRQIVVPEEDEIREIATLLEGGESFAAVALQRSRVQSSQSEGQLPLIGWGTMEGAWDEVAFGMEPGEISRPFASGGAWEILLLEEKQPVEKPAYSEAHDKLESILLQRGLDEKERVFSSYLFEKYAVVVKLTPFEPGIYTAALANDPEIVVAIWQGGALTIGELAPHINFHDLASLTPRQSAREIEEQVRTSVTKPLLLLEAKARKYDELKKIQSSAQTAREKAILAVLHNGYIYKDLVVSDADVRSWYDSNTEEILVPEKRFVSQILIKTEEDARAVQERLAEGTPFADLAREVSLDMTSAVKGGALGWITEKDSPPGFQEVFSLPRGEFSDPIQTEIGWHLIRVLEIQSPRARSYEETQERIRSYLVKEKREEAREVWLAQLRDAAKIKINESAVSAFVEENVPATP